MYSYFALTCVRVFSALRPACLTEHLKIAAAETRLCAALWKSDMFILLSVM